VLDLGSGTGWAHDAGITVPHRYWAIDSSQAMMNELIRRHQQARNVLVARAEDVALASLLQRFDLLLAVDVGMIPSATLARFATLADVLVVAD
jgi:predicted TPR repeat methyltransferase